MEAEAEGARVKEEARLAKLAERFPTVTVKYPNVRAPGLNNGMVGRSIGTLTW